MMYLARILRPAAEYSSDAHGALLCSTRRQASSNASSKILVSSGWKTSGANCFRNPRTTHGPRAPAAQRAQILCPRGNFEKPIVVQCSKFHRFRVNEKLRGPLRKPLSQPNDCERVPLTALGSSDAASIKLSGGLIGGGRRFSLPKSLIMAQGLPHGLEPRERGGRVVLNNLNEQIRECLQHAEDCALKAAAQTDPKLVSRRRHF